jgi:hypothetical protein
VQRLCDRGGRLPDGVAGLVGVATADPPRLLLACDGARSAPALTLVAGVANGTVPAAGGVAATSDAAAPATSGQRLLAAALLAIGVAILAVAVVAKRRFESDDPGADLPEDADGDVAPPAGPRLALVRLPDERGP